MAVRRVPGPARAPLEAMLKQIGEKVGKVGWFAGKSYPKDGPPVAYVAAIQEYGYPEGGIPPRLGMRTVNGQEKTKWAALAANLAKQMTTGKRTVDSALDVLGLQAAGDYRKHITGPISPPLKPATVEARLRGYAHVSKTVISVSVAKPLVNTKLLLNSLTNTVEEDGGDA